MTIVANDSITVSNVNDGTITHTAWSYSADGMDRFTTVYPNLNLLTGTSNQVVQANNWYMQVADIKYDKSLGGALCASVFFNNADHASDLLRGSATIMIETFDKSGKSLTTVYGNSVSYNANGLSQSSISIDDNTANVKAFIFTNNMNSNAFYSCLKIEQGSIATPWMRSASEVTTSDYPSYIGTYSDSKIESSSDYSKYQWTIFKGQDSNAYTAYSWSSDGTDRFSTAYPNLNLLKGTKTPKSITGNNTANQGGLLFPFDNDKTLTNQGFSINDVLTLEFDWNATNPASGYFILQWQGAPWGFSLPTINISSTNGSGHIVYTFNVRDKDIASTAYATGIGYRFDNIPSDTVITFSNLIISKAKGSQPWMPSQSETQEQWQDAIPMYVGVGEKDSQNPSDYRWQLNPRYVQASSDNGLSNKAGLDDLASVTDTANDALVQAQNAVSNEDYTSWLEHDYQTTINNLQDVSAQNQEDINNVDDRTTIVEGFYGEMKVKWNFIDESFSFSEEGMFISNAQSKMSIQITSDKIVFWDNNVDVAFITGEVLNIQKGVFLESATIGNHLITKFSDDSPVTIIRYVGGIT